MPELAFEIFVDAQAELGSEIERLLGGAGVDSTQSDQISEGSAEGSGP